jgi:hypothetical protein
LIKNRQGKPYPTRMPESLGAPERNNTTLVNHISHLAEAHCSRMMKKLSFGREPIEYQAKADNHPAVPLPESSRDE